MFLWLYMIMTHHFKYFFSVAWVAAGQIMSMISVNWHFTLLSTQDAVQTLSLQTDLQFQQQSQTWGVLKMKPNLIVIYTSTLQKYTELCPWKIIQWPYIILSFIMMLIRVPQNCFETLQLLAYDPDGDDVRCTCPSCNEHPNIYVDEVMFTYLSS